MQQNSTVAAAQGASANRSSMPFSQTSPAGKKSAPFLPFKKRPIFLLTALFLFSSTIGYAQDIVSLPLSQFGLKVTAPNQVLQAGESATFTVELLLPVVEAMEFVVDLDLGAAALPPQPSDLDFQNTWFASSISAPPGLALAANQIEVQLISDPLASGSGTLFEVTVVAGQNDVPAGDLLRIGGGHVLVLVDDLGFKQAPTAQQEGVQIYPNPCSEVMHFNWEGEAPREMRLFNQQGVEVARIDQSILENGHWTLPDLPRGCYHAVVLGKEGVLDNQVVFIQ